MLARLARLEVIVIVVGTILWQATKPAPLQACSARVVSPGVDTWACIGGVAELHLTSRIHSSAMLYTSRPVELAPVGSLAVTRAGDRAWYLPDASDARLLIRSTVSYSETVVFGRVQ